ncbi:MAG: hypothetical protein ABIE22_05570 [archaeon]
MKGKHLIYVSENIPEISSSKDKAICVKPEQLEGAWGVLEERAVQGPTMFGKCDIRQTPFNLDGTLVTLGTTEGRVPNHICLSAILEKDLSQASKALNLPYDRKMVVEGESPPHIYGAIPSYHI